MTKYVIKTGNYKHTVEAESDMDAVILAFKEKQPMEAAVLTEIISLPKRQKSYMATMAALHKAGYSVDLSPHNSVMPPLPRKERTKK